MQKLKIWKVIKKSRQLVSRSFMMLLIMMTIVELLALVIVKELSSRALHLALSASSIAGITNENYLLIFRHPTALFILINIIIVSALFILLQLTITISYANSHYTKSSFSLMQSIKSISRIGVTQLPILLVYIFLILPNGNIGISSAITTNLHLPEFIIGYIFENPLYTALYIFGLLTAFYLNLRFFYSFVIFSQEKISFVDSMKKSWNLTKKNKLRILGLITVISLLTFLGIILISGALMGAFFAIAAYYPVYEKIANAVLQTLFLFVMAYFVSMMKMLLIQATVVSYHELEGNEIVERPQVKMKSSYRRLINVGLAISFMGLSFFVYIDVPNNSELDMRYIVSHRGESTLAIENTLASLQLAKTYQPDFVEMDIQQTKDHQIVVFHDFVLKRLAGDKRRVNEVEWSELKEMSITTSDHEDAIPLFSDYLALASQLDQPLMVEIKTTANDSDDYLEEIMQQIEKANMKDKVVFQTLDLDAALAMKEKYPQSIVGYILGFNLGGLENLKVDFYSIEASSVTKRVLREASFFQKGLFVWSLNDSDSMRTYLQADVTGIITDDPLLAKEVVAELKEQKLSDIFWSLDFEFI